MYNSMAGPSMISILSVFVPILGIAAWVILLPSTRRLLGRRTEQFKEAVGSSPTQPEPAEEETSSSRRRELDPELVKFDRSIFDRFSNEE